MATPDYKTELEQLRRDYVEADPRQRWRIAQHRVRNLHHGPNRLVAAVSAVEGFARSLVVERRAASKAERWKLYGEYRNKSAEELVTEYLERRALPKFDDETWRLFGFAVQYRNLLVHECTYLGDDRATPLINACFVILHSLAESQGLAEPKVAGAGKPANRR